MRPILLEDHKPDSIPTLVSIRKQGDYRAFSSLHAFCNCHAPRSIYHKQHEISLAFYPDFALKVLFTYRKGHFPSVAFLLKRRSSTESCIKSNIGCFAICWTSLDVASALALCTGAAAPTTLAAGELIQRSIEALGYLKLLPGLNLLAPIPPVSILIPEYILFMGVGGGYIG